MTADERAELAEVSRCITEATAALDRIIASLDETAASTTALLDAWGSNPEDES